MKIIQIYEKDYPNNLYIDFFYISNKYYKISLEMKRKSWKISFKLKKFDKKFVHKENVQFFSPFKEITEYYVVLNENGNQIGWMSIGKIKWKKTARLWDLFVHKSYLRKGIGTEMLKLAENRVNEWDYRALEIETQSSNYNAIQFYLHNGYTLSGLDSICYTNNDINRNEVRIELVKKFKIK